MKREREFDYNFWLFVIASISMGLFFVSQTFSKEVKTVRLDDKGVGQIRISPRGTILSFPTKPAKVILGSKGSFGIEYVENDLAISPMTALSRSNLFVYLEGRRFSFHLVTSEREGDDIILIRDQLDTQFRVNVK